MSFDLRIKDGDVVIGQNGDVEIVENTDKLVQDILKIVLTPIGSNPFHPWYGSPISKSLVGRALEEDFISSIATQQLQTSLDRLMSLQQAQLKENQLVTASEQIAAVQRVLVERNISDPRFYTIFLTILSKAFSKTDIPINISL